MYKVYFSNIYVNNVHYGNILLPVTPEKITMKIGNNNKTLDLINGGEINFLRTPSLTEFSFDFLIPQVQYPFSNYPDGFQDAAYYVGMLEHLKTSKKPFTFSVYRTMPNGTVMFTTNMNVSLEDYTLTEDVKEGLDSTASIKLKEYVEHKTTAYKATTTAIGTTAVTAAVARASDKEKSKAYTVKKGDTLWAICKANLGDGSKFGEIAKINGITNANLIYQGQVIKFA